jgi:tRNA pseudouridine55 synthase
MVRRRKGRPVHGWIVIDKAKGDTATRTVGAVRRLFQAQKAGHAGTLDPIATGVLPVALGEATKTVPFVMDTSKAYAFTVRWGEARDTDDAEGRVTATSDVRPDAAAIEAALPGFVGTIEQRPPAYSAIKVGGRRAYDLARADAPPDLPARPVVVDRLTLTAIVDADHAAFALDCGKGVYVRSLARDLAHALGTVGHVAELRRTRVGPFAEDRAISLAKLALFGHSPATCGPGGDAGPDVLMEYLLPIEAALDDIPALSLTDNEAGRLRNGQPVPVLRTANRELIGNLTDGATLWASAGGLPVAIVRLEGRQVHPVRVFNL